MAMIELQNVTKDYGDSRGIFNINLSIESGEAFGFAGTNGAGKTTTIRHLMGFLKPNTGTVKIKNLDAWHNAAEIKQWVGYIPGEIAFPDVKTGWEFIHQQAELLKLTDLSYANQIIERLQLDPSANIKRMSKGMKQKTAIVVALMANAPILILDEPTTGLDPLMRAEFIQIIKEEKAKGKTIFMSSHMFEEIEETCDKVAMIKEGKIITIKSISTITSNENQQFIIEFSNEQECTRFIQEKIDSVAISNTTVSVNVENNTLNKFLAVLSTYQFDNLTEQKHTLQEQFYHLYSGGQSND
ncbi:ATP-binding cassette domain-containing protein [Lysinibacillus agricola]|uniref:ATP-binding cassette domain-containing protein n=2 Tax=Bacillaceae TaxID=186817 RepID=A0ABX7ALM7_9BACI|nr:ABC transporter ATP-binding protein [Lysinibacillus sp. FJAT-14222]QQP10312.1 ATP-binding cassette domain-containing protein [Lysinibacillus agricola]